MCQTTNLKKHATTLWYLHLFTEIEPPLWCFNGDGIRIPWQELGHVFEEISSLCHWINRKKSLNQQRCGNDVPDPNRNAKKKLINKHGDWTNKNGNGNNTDAEQLEWTWKSTMYILNYATKVIYRKRMGKKKNIMIEPAKHEKMVRCISTQDMQLPEWTMLDPQFSGEIPMKISDSGYPMAISDSLTIFSLNSMKSICVDCKTSIYTGLPNISLPCLKFKPWKFHESVLLDAQFLPGFEHLQEPVPSTWNGHVQFWQILSLFKLQNMIYLTKRV